MLKETCNKNVCGVSSGFAEQPQTKPMGTVVSRLSTPEPSGAFRFEVYYIYYCCQIWVGGRDFGGLLVFNFIIKKKTPTRKPNPNCLFVRFKLLP